MTLSKSGFGFIRQKNSQPFHFEKSMQFIMANVIHLPFPLSKFQVSIWQVCFFKIPDIPVQIYFYFSVFSREKILPSVFEVFKI